MTFWTLMLISFVEGDTRYDPALAYPSVSECGEAIERVGESLSKVDPDLSIRCVRTDVLSSTIRPVARPD